MTHLSDQQEKLRSSIKKGAVTWGVILGLIVAGIVYWLLGGQSGLVRSAAAVGTGLIVAGLVFRKSMSSGADAAKCENCGAMFSVARVDRQEVLVNSEDRETRKELENGDTEITTWVEEKYDVTDTYECSKCQNTTTKTYQNSRKRDEKTAVKTAHKKGRKPASDINKQRGSKSSDKN